MCVETIGMFGEIISLCLLVFSCIDNYSLLGSLFKIYISSIYPSSTDIIWRNEAPNMLNYSTSKTVFEELSHLTSGRIKSKFEMRLSMIRFEINNNLLNSL